MISHRQRGICLACLLLALIFPAAGLRAEDIHVTVIGILATDQNSKIDPRLQGIAEEIQKLEPGLTGFRLERQSLKPVAIGQTGHFTQVEKQEVAVTVDQGADKDGKVKLTVKPPQVGEITLNIVFGKYFPVVTRFRTKNKERLIIAVMVKSGKK